MVDRPTRLLPTPSAEDRGTLARLAELAGLPELIGPAPISRSRRSADAVLPSLNGVAAAPARMPEHNPRLAFASASATDALLGWSTGFAPSPEFDDDHPEEISYRPFPIGPFLTATASADDSVLLQLVHPDIGRAVELLDQQGTAPPMRLRPAPKLAQLMWAQQFSGEAVQLDRLTADTAHATGLSERRVKTAAER